MEQMSAGEFIFQYSIGEMGLHDLAPNQAALAFFPIDCQPSGRVIINATCNRVVIEHGKLGEWVVQLLEVIERDAKRVSNSTRLPDNRALSHLVEILYRNRESQGLGSLIDMTTVIVQHALGYNEALKFAFNCDKKH